LALTALLQRGAATLDAEFVDWQLANNTDAVCEETHFRELPQQTNSVQMTVYCRDSPLCIVVINPRRSSSQHRNVHRKVF
jgi:hypothetical protein